MKSKILTGAVLACSLAFMNCDDSTSAATDGLAENLSSAQELAVSSNSNPTELLMNMSSASTENPAGTIPANPASSATDPAVNPASADTPTSAPSADPASSATDPAVNPASADTPVPADPTSAPSTDPVNPAVDPTSAPSADPASSAATPASSSEKKDTPVTVSSSSEAPAAESSSSAPEAQPAPKKIFLSEGTEEEKDQMRVEYKQGTGPDGKSILSYPSQLSNDQKHGIVVWGPGGGTAPSAYEGMIRRLASHGFVVIALRESPGDGHLATEALNWLAQQNENPGSPLNGKLDMNTVGCAGHSMGGLESEQAVIKDKRVLTAMLNNSGDMGHTAMSQVATDRTIAIIYGEGGSERGNAEADYGNNGVKAPACLIKMTGGQGNECYNGECGYGHGSASWDGMAGTVAWMRWHLGGEDFRKADFVGTSGKYIDGPIIGKRGNWRGQCKNF